MIGHTVAELLDGHVGLDIEGIDRLYLNLYQPRLQTGGGVVGFFKGHRGAQVASTTLMAPMTREFAAAVQAFAKREGVEIVHFAKGQRKDDETQRRLKDFSATEGVLYIGVAQERCSTFRVTKRFSERTGSSFPWLYRSTVMCNHYYFYLVDADFGPLFIKFSGYFPYTARACLNGHEYAKCQLRREGIAFAALDNGVHCCDDPPRLQQIADTLDAARIEAVVRKWLARLPQPFTPADRTAGYDYDISILQAEFARTQVFDRPLSGRHLFEEIIRENLDLGRPEQVSLIFDRRISRRTPGRFRTRVITRGVTPSLHVDYKSTRIKQYFKEERALRTETTINNTRDFGLGRRLHNLPALRAIGFNANRRMLEVERISQDCRLADSVFAQVNSPCLVDGQRASALPFGNARVMALLQALCLFILLPEGFRNAALRGHVAELLGIPVAAYTPGRMTYDLRRLRLHGLISRIPHTHRYELTHFGKRVALFYTKLNARILRPGFSQLFDGCPNAPDRPLADAAKRLDTAFDKLIAQAKLAARNLTHLRRKISPKQARRIIKLGGFYLTSRAVAACRSRHRAQQPGSAPGQRCLAGLAQAEAGAGGVGPGLGGSEGGAGAAWGEPRKQLAFPEPQARW